MNFVNFVYTMFYKVYIQSRIIRVTWIRIVRIKITNIGIIRTTLICMYGLKVHKGTDIYMNMSMPMYLKILQKFDCLLSNY